MSKLEIFKDRNFDSTKDNNFEITEGNENKKNAENLTKKEMEIGEKIKQAKDRMEYIAKTEIADAEYLLEGLTGQKKEEKVDRNIQNHISQGEEKTLDANGDGKPDGEQAKDSNSQTREDEEAVLSQQSIIVKPKEDKNSVLTQHNHTTQFGNNKSNQPQKKSAEAGAETSGGLE